jgi:transcription initiation factor TFIIF subunit beta
LEDRQIFIISTTHKYTNMDKTNVSRPLWLVKVPKYLADKLEKFDSAEEAAKLTWKKSADGTKEYSLTISESLANMDPSLKIPTNYNLKCAPLYKRNIHIFSENKSNDNVDKYKLEGRIVRKHQCQAVMNEEYFKFKTKAIQRAEEPTKTTKRISHVVNFKPISNHQHNILNERKKKVEAKKCRADKDVVMESLFKAFEKHQYYNIRDLVGISNQPIGYLKEILREYCNYNTKNPHKNMWELKKEYRYYKEDN